MSHDVIPANDPNLTSFVNVDVNSDFPIQNLPFGIFKPDANAHARVGVAIGDQVLDLSEIANAGLFDDVLNNAVSVFTQDNLNAFMALGQPIWRAVRNKISQLLQHDNPSLRDNEALRKTAFFNQAAITLLLPVAIGGYTDFYSSKEHATNLGTMFRDKDNPLLPNWLHIPVGYDGRASSIVVSGTPFHRPTGQIKPNDEEPPIQAASQRLDTELELGFIVGVGNQMGESIAVDAAAQHIFGAVLLHDRSARDIQKWEYVPLGPFLGKNFCTTISPWVVTLDALQPFRVNGPEQNPTPLPYLQSKQAWGFNIDLAIKLKTAAMEQADTISKTNFKTVYWSCAQQLAHHTINGCRMQTGDLFASGTVSGSTPDAYGSLLELAWAGQKPIKLSSGETRVFLADGDSVMLNGACQGDGYKIGFGEAEGTVLPAKIG